MSDGDSSILGAVADAGKDFVREAVEQVTVSATGSLKSAAQQVAGYTPQEDEAKKKAQQMATFQRIKAIESEMAQIATHNSQKKGPEIAKSGLQKAEEFEEHAPKAQIDEASRQALGRAEQGRNFKG